MDITKILSSCTDTLGEVYHFEDVVDLLSKQDIPDRLWEEIDNGAICKHTSHGDCIQVVLGRLSQTKEYIACPDYLVLNISDWTIDKNDLFIEQITRPHQMISNRPLCSKFPIRLCHNKYPEHHLEDNQTKISPGSVTTREICLLKVKSYYFYQPDDADYFLLSKRSNLARSGLVKI